MDDFLRSKLAALGVKLGVEDITAPLNSRFYKLEELVASQIKQNMFGETLVIEKRYPRDYKHGNVALSLRPGAGWIAALTKQPGASDISSDQFMYLDVETTSLSTGAGSYPFLIGLCRILPDEVEISLLMMRTLSEEKAMLAELISQCSKSKVVVTYNGASFDLPMIRSRLSLYALPDPFSELIHIDLLPVTRKLWKNTLPSRSLSHLEMTLLGVSRSQIEVPGYLIPQIYFDYLKTGDARPLLGVLYHNEMDILSLAALFNFLADETSSVEILNQLPAMEQNAILKILLDLGEADRVLTLLNQLAEKNFEGIDSILVKRLVSWCRKNQHYSELFRVLLSQSNKNDLWAIEALAIYYERVEHNLDAAIISLTTLKEEINRSLLPPFSKRRETEKIDKKLERIARKLKQYPTI